MWHTGPCIVERHTTQPTPSLITLTHSLFSNMVQSLCFLKWPHTFWHLYFCSHCSLCLEGTLTSISHKNLSVLPNLSASDIDPFLIYSNSYDRLFLWTPKLLLMSFKWLWKILKVEDLSRWSESPLKFHAKFEGMCTRAFFEERLHGFHQWLKEQHNIHPHPRNKLGTFLKFPKENLIKQIGERRSRRKDE